MPGSEFGPCGSCGGEEVAVFVDNEALGTAGPIEISCVSCGVSLQLPEEATARTRIQAMRHIARGNAQRVEGYLVDMQTAGLLVAVYEALSPKNRERFGKPPLERLVALAWKVAK